MHHKTLVPLVVAFLFIAVTHVSFSLSQSSSKRRSEVWTCVAVMILIS